MFVDHVPRICSRCHSHSQSRRHCAGTRTRFDHILKRPDTTRQFAIDTLQRVCTGWTLPYNHWTCSIHHEQQQMPRPSSYRNAAWFACNSSNIRWIHWVYIYTLHILSNLESGFLSTSSRSKTHSNFQCYWGQTRYFPQSLLPRLSSLDCIRWWPNPIPIGQTAWARGWHVFEWERLIRIKIRQMFSYSNTCLHLSHALQCEANQVMAQYFKTRLFGDMIFFETWLWSSRGFSSGVLQQI